MTEKTLDPITTLLAEWAEEEELAQRLGVSPRFTRADAIEALKSAWRAQLTIESGDSVAKLHALKTYGDEQYADGVRNGRAQALDGLEELAEERPDDAVDLLDAAHRLEERFAKMGVR